jgi:hypothetical protein
MLLFRILSLYVMGYHLLKLWIGCQLLLAAEGFKELPGCGLCGLLHYFDGIPQTQRLSGTGLYACRAFGPIHTQITLDSGLLFSTGSFSDSNMDGAKRTDDHAEPATDAETLIHCRESISAVGSACGADPYAGRVLALAALGGKFDAIHLYHAIARLQSLTSYDCTNNGA